MLGGIRTATSRRGREEGEKPFWISFSDLMSALMVLFLVAMTVALVVVTEEKPQDPVPTPAASPTDGRGEAILEFMDGLGRDLQSNGVSGYLIDGQTIKFPKTVFFERENQNTLSKESRDLIFSFVPVLLQKIRDTNSGKGWFKNILVEGYTSSTGSYLYNLALSQERSQRIICELLSRDSLGRDLFSDEDRVLIATSFFAGGASFNSLQGTPEQSRRVEFKIQFWSAEEMRDQLIRPRKELDEGQLLISLNNSRQCPIFSR